MALGKRKWWLGGMLLALAPSCGGGDEEASDNSSEADAPGAPMGDDPGDPANAPNPGDVTEAAFLSEFSTAVCRGLEPCCLEAGFSYNQALCLALTSPAQSRPASVVFDGQSAAACLTALRVFDGTCRADTDVEACSRVYVGNKVPGEACTDTVECAIPEDGERECDAFDEVCQVIRRGAAEEPCSDSCEAGAGGGWSCFTANFDTAPSDDVVQCWREDGLTCDGEVCSALGRAGDPCSLDGDCSDEAYCNGGTCVARAEVGQACTSSAECAADAYCDGTCQEKNTVGGSCTVGEECLGGVCEAGTCGADAAADAVSDLVLSFVCGG